MKGVLWYQPAGSNMLYSNHGDSCSFGDLSRGFAFHPANDSFYFVQQSTLSVFYVDQPCSSSPPTLYTSISMQSTTETISGFSFDPFSGDFLLYVPLFRFVVAALRLLMLCWLQHRQTPRVPRQQPNSTHFAAQHRGSHVVHASGIRGKRYNAGRRHYHQPCGTHANTQLCQRHNHELERECCAADGSISFVFGDLGILHDRLSGARDRHRHSWRPLRWCGFLTGHQPAARHRSGLHKCTAVFLRK